MEHAPVTTEVDGFGRRTNGIDAETGDEVELLDLSPQLVEHSGFVTAVGERVARFATVRHASYVHLRRLDRPAADRLELVSDATPGWRLSELLSESSAAGIPVDITVVIGLLRQLLPAVALYGRHNREAAIGTLAVERLIVTPQSRLVIAEHAFGPALEKLNIGRDRLWRELRVAMPPSAGLPRSNQRADANAIGVVALSLLLGRALTVDEFPAQIQPLLEGAKEHRDGKPSPLSASFATWLGRALQLDVRTAFQAPSEAQLAFESVLASDRSYVTSSTKLEEWVALVSGPIEERRRPKPDPEALRQAELAREQEAERQREAERQKELERQQEEEREREREAELARLRELERARAEELEQLREQERQRALEVERLKEQERAREQERERERAQNQKREQELAREREQNQEREREREQARAREREQERQREEERQRELERERERARAAEKSAAAAAAAAAAEAAAAATAAAEAAAARERAAANALNAQQEPEPAAWAPSPVAEEDPIAAQIASYRPPVRAVEEVPAYEAPAPEEPAPATPAYETPAYETPADEAPAQESPAYEEPAPAPAYAQQAEPAPSPYTISEEPEKKSKLPLMAVAAVVVLLLAVIGWLATRDTGGGMREGEGELAVTSRPDGAIVKVDSKEVGRTPVTVRLPSGPHVLEVQVGKAEPRVIPLTITAGVQTSQYIELQNVAATGSLEIRSNPSGARITIDGQPRGTTPATIPNLSAGDHSVVLELGGRKVTQAVRIQAGSTAQLVVPIPRK